MMFGVHAFGAAPLSGGEWPEVDFAGTVTLDGAAELAAQADDPYLDMLSRDSDRLFGVELTLHFLADRVA